LIAIQAFGEFEGNSLAPADRLIANTTAYIKEHPTDPMGPYTLARVHYLAFATRGATLNAWPNDGRALPEIYDPMPTRPQSSNLNPMDASLRVHLTEAIENFRKAIQMDEKNGLFHLGLASISRQALSSGLELGAIPGMAPADIPKDGNFTAVWREQAIAEYLKAYQLSIDTTAMIRAGSPGGGTVTSASYEAGTRYVEMVGARGVRDSERTVYERIKDSLPSLSKQGISFITPIVFRLTAPVRLEALLDAGKTVAFDLAGSGIPQRYTWLRPDTGILVWDPTRAGRITSGHQLFGSVTFQMFWPDGYRAIDALDDNRDGELRGAELDGLAVWFDLNQNGVSDAGEVTPIEKTGIASISARATTCIGASLANETGLIMTDGRALPTYDWTTTPLKDPPASSGS
jgi:hypothetical protein